jgi:hypothetical protein
MDFFKEIQKKFESNPEFVHAFHCWGGKGRTGTMVCMFLLYFHKCKTTEEAMKYFATKRNVGEHFKGVETPTQIRFVKYFEEIVSNNNALPAEKCLKLKSFIIRHKSIGNYSNIVVQYYYLKSN